MTTVRRSLAALLAVPLRLAPIDLMVAMVVIVFALSLVVAPVAAQGASPSAAATAAAASAPPPTPAPATAVPATAVPATGAPTGAPVPTASAGASLSTTGSPAPGASASPAVSAAPGAAAPCPIPDPPPTPPAPSASPRPHNLCPAEPKGTDPFSLLAWAFTPIFQVLFMGLALLYGLFHDVGIAIAILTILIRLLLVPVFRAQIVSQRRMQMVQPELKAIQAKYKGNRAKISEEQMKLYKDRGVNPASGCLPALLQMVLLVPMYQVISQGLNAPDVSSMLQVFGNKVINVACQAPGNIDVPCIDPHVGWLAWLPRIDTAGLSFHDGGMLANKPEIFLMVLPGLFGLSLLALVSAVLQLIQTRMMTTPSDDPSQRSQQRIFLILPLFSLIYGWFLPSGLFIYWIVTTVFSIVQQYLINGWGGLFPLFGWTPGFARGHKPRFPVKPLTLRGDAPGVSGSSVASGATPASARRSAADSAAGTIKPARGRTSRRGRRR